MDVERGAGRVPAGRVSRQRRSAAGRRRATNCAARYATSDQHRRRAVAGLGRASSVCARAFRFPSARSMRTGTPSARASASAMSSTWSAPPPASWRSRAAGADSRRVRRGAGSIHPAVYRHRSGALGHRRYLRSDRAPRRHDGGGAVAQVWNKYRAGETGLLRLTWDNGDRTVLVNPELGGITLGWNLTHTAQDELFAAIEGTAFHTRIILERMEEHGVPIHRVINGGGIPQKNAALNQVYANVLEQADAGAARRRHQPGVGHLRVSCGRDIPNRRRGAGGAVPGLTNRRTAADCRGGLRGAVPLYRKLYFSFGRAGSAPVSIGDVCLHCAASRHEAHGGRPC